MRKKEIVVLDCGVEVRTEDQGVLFSSMTTDREFAFGIKLEEIPDMVVYLNSYLTDKTATIHKFPSSSLASDVPKRELTSVEKARSVGVEAGSLVPPSAAKGGRVIPQSAVSIHKGP